MQAQPAGKRGNEFPGMCRVVARRRIRRREQRGILPQRPSVAAPETGKRPARQRFAGIPLALAVMQVAALAEAFSKLAQEFACQAQLVLTECGGVPLCAFHVVDGDEGRLTTHGQHDLVVFQLAVHLLAERVNAPPL